MTTSALPLAVASARRALPLPLFALLVMASLALLAMTASAPLVAMALGATFGAAAMLLRPALATLVVMFLLYINVPAILTQRFGLSEVVAGSFLALLGLPLLHMVTMQRQPLKSDRVFFLMVAFLGALVLSSLGAVNRAIAVKQVTGFLFEGLLVYWLALNVVRDLPTLRRVMTTIIAGGAVVSGLCLYQDLTGSYSRDFGGLAYRNYDVLRDGDVRGRVERGKYDRAQGPVNEPNRFAQILIVLVPMAAYLYRTTNRPGRRRFILACGALILIGIALTLSRGAIVALALMAAAMTRLRWVRPSRVGTCVIALLLALPLITPFYLDRVASLINVTRFMGGDQSDYREADGAMRGRVTEMLAAWRVFVDHPLLGVGPGQFAPYYVERYSRDPEIKFRQIVGARRAHTLYFEVAAETGLLGLVLFMGIAVHLLRRLWWTRSAWLARDPALADLATAFWLSVMAYLCTGVFLHLAYQRYYWLLIALATAALHVAAWKRPAAGRGAFAGGARWQRLH